MRNWKYSIDNQCVVIVYKDTIENQLRYVVEIPDNANDILKNNNISFDIVQKSSNPPVYIKTSLPRLWQIEKINRFASSIDHSELQDMPGFLLQFVKIQFMIIYTLVLMKL